MSADLTVYVAALIGFTHAFEADHLVAVGNIVTRRDRIGRAMKDGVYWGLGHSSTILLIGMIVILGRTAISGHVFDLLEGGVGLMLIGLGVWRLSARWRQRHALTAVDEADGYGIAYGVGLVHGLAGSGALILLVLSQGDESWHGGLLYLLIFGLGSVGGMLVAAGVLSLPFSRAVLSRPKWRGALVGVSSVVCILYGGTIVADLLH
jgi:hypothetical protein